MPSSVTNIFLLLGLASMPALADSLDVSEPVQVSHGREEIPHVEPYLAAHPRDPSLLVGAAVTLPSADLDQSGGDVTTATFVSNDAGRTWKSQLLPQCSVDPWIAFGPGDSVYLSCLAKEPPGTLVFRSDDGGKSWTEPVRLPLGDGGTPDRPVLAVNRNAGERVGTVYVAQGQSYTEDGLRQRLYGPTISSSSDRAATFSEPVIVRHNNTQQQPFDSAILSDGSLVVVFMDYAAGSRLLSHRRTWLVRSVDGGESFTTPTLVLEQQGSEMPWSLAVDESSRHRDRLYLAIDGYWKRRPPSRDEIDVVESRGVLVTTSDDHGETWSAPTTVSGAGPSDNQETPVIAVNSRGDVGVAWYDTRHDERGECFDIYFTASIDGGATYLSDVRVTPETSCPRGEENPHRGLAQRWAFGGDYSGLAASADGAFHIFWADTRQVSYQVWTATARLPETSIE